MLLINIVFFLIFKSTIMLEHAIGIVVRKVVDSMVGVIYAVFFASRDEGWDDNDSE